MARAERKVLAGGSAAALILALGAPTGAAERGVRPRPGIEAALRAMHDGRFEAARAALASTGPERGGDLSFFRAFTGYWRLLYDPENESLRRSFERELDHAIAAAETSLRDDVEDPDALVWSGNARLLLAQLRATEKKPFAAAFEARRAKHRLEEAVEAGADSPEPLFGLGTYNYVADRLPAFVKGLKALLFLPGGNRERGLAQLERAAAESRYFALEARILLATIYANRHERLYEMAGRQAELALRAEPEAIAVLHGVAMIDLALARPERALGRLESALARGRALGDVDASVMSTLELAAARAQFARLRPDLALDLGRRILARGPSSPADVRRDAAEVVSLSEPLVRLPFWTLAGPVVAEEGVPAEEIAQRLAGLTGETQPGDPTLAFLAGRAFLVTGQGEEALRWLAVADDSGRLPAPWLGPCRLFAGQAADLAGERSRALAYYRRAEQGAAFLGKDAARHFQTVPYRGGS